MGKLDEVKEILNTLRVAMSIAFGILVLILGRLVSMYGDKQFDMIFWLTFIGMIINVIAIILIVRKLSSKTKEIRDL